MPETTVIDDAQCKKDHALWTEEIAAWRNDHARALGTLEQVKSFILAHEAELDEHLQEVREHEAAKEQAHDGVQTMRERHFNVKLRHNALRGRHRSLIEQVLQLQVTLHKASRGKVL